MTSPPQPLDLLVVGRPSVDIMFAGLQEWPALGKDIDATGLGVCAGTSFNTPAAANRLGLRVGYVSVVGDDVWGRLILDEYAAEGLPTDFLRVVDHLLPFVSVALNFAGDRGFVTHAAEGAREEDDLARYAREVVSGTPARHFHGYVAEEPPGLTALAKARGMSVSLDAWGGPWWESGMPLDEALADADVLFANEPEALGMAGVDDLHQALGRLASACPCVVVKRGALGAAATSAGQVVERPAEPAEVVDTTGAGDCFNAGFLVGWLAGLPLADALTLATFCGARAVEAFGGYRGCPRADELGAFAASRGITLSASGDGPGQREGDAS